MLPEGEGADLGVRRHRVADPHATRALDEAFDEGLGDRALHKDARAREALLPVVAVDAGERAVERPLDVRRLENDVGGFAAEFERDGLEVATRRGRDGPARRGAAGEAHHVDAGMGDQRVAGHGTTAVHEVHDARGQAGLVEDLDHAAHGQRRVLGGFEHAGVAPGDAGRDAHGGQRERCIPGRNAARDALGLARDVGQVALGLGVGFTVDGAGDLREEFEVARHALHVDPYALERQPGVQAFEVGEFLGVAPEVVADRVQDVLALVDVHARPRA